MKNFYLPILFSVFITVTSFSQNFNNITNESGLGAVKENNGVSVADYDQDGDLDIFVVAKRRDDFDVYHSQSRLFRNNNNGSFTDVTYASNLINLLPKGETDRKDFSLKGSKFGVFWGDYDNDGFPDILFSFINKISLFHNNQDGTFTDVTASSLIVLEPTCISPSSSWIDYNNDGYLDVFINDFGQCDGNILYKNNQDGTFSKIDTPEIDAQYSYATIPFDFNNDGNMDLYTTNDHGTPNTLLLNQGDDTFIESETTYNVDSKINDMGIAIGDYDNNSYFDFFITGIDESSFLENDGNNNFSEVSVSKNISDNDWAWGTKFADFDNDSDLDLIVVNGFDSFLNPIRKQPNKYYRNELSETGLADFTEIASTLGLDDVSMSVEVVDFDFDNDGDLDLIITNTDAEVFFYENLTVDQANSNESNWLKIKLKGTNSNPDTVGTKIKIVTNENTLYRYYTGIGFASQSIKPEHFGIKDATSISEVEITWPNGTVEVFNNLEINSHYEITEGSTAIKLNVTPSIKVPGCTEPTACNFNPSATVNNGSCTYLAPSTISGNINSGFYKTETYSYPKAPESSIVWSVNNGEIKSGQGTNTIEVEWHIGDIGTVNVIENGTSCSSEIISQNVHLSINEIPSDISIARIWNEALLEAIRKDYARPTVHARNLFHSSIAMYDAWAIYNDNIATTYLVGKTLNGYSNVFDGFSTTDNYDDAITETISYAMYRLLRHRFKNSPGKDDSYANFQLIMDQSGYSTGLTTTDYSTGEPAALGNYIAEVIINYGALDNSREDTDYDNSFYTPVNAPLVLASEETISMNNPNQWQPLRFNTFIDQSGHLVQGSTPGFLSPEWGVVYPFALSSDDKKVLTKDANSYTMYHDPGQPPYLNETTLTEDSELYQWNFSLVSIWSAHLDPTDGVMWDISPKSIGNIEINSMPTSFSDYDQFYDYMNGGDISQGWSLNPKTNQPYETQMVPRADYARVLAEFWADGPDSETPPGHWFTILNYVSDHDEFTKQFNGTGATLSDLEWDIKAYFVLGGAMHDAAVTAWGIKGWYDYIRPISAIRYMASLGQSSDNLLPNYHVAGIPLVPGYIELITDGDPLEGDNKENVDKIKVKAWRGHKFIDDSSTDVAGVDWILANEWWPYQRPSFVTPPFAGYVSGHSTFSRAAAEAMTLLTGDEFFPGGMGEFIAKKDEFLVFEKGPSVDVKLQWATYRDASEQTSLSRIWGGIHPPADDIPGRLMGEKIGVDAYQHAVKYFNGTILSTKDYEQTDVYTVYPNPVSGTSLSISNTKSTDVFEIYNMAGQKISSFNANFDGTNTVIKFETKPATGMYVLKINNFSKLIFIEN